MNLRTFLRIVGSSATFSIVPAGGLSLGESIQMNLQERAGHLERSTPESQGIPSSALLAFVAKTEERLNSLHSVMVARNGSVVAEGWWAPYAPELNHWLFSLSKGFTSTGVGIAIGEGLLRLDDPVISFFRDDAPVTPSENLKAMTVRDLLTMTHGHHGNSDKVMQSDNPDWTKA